MTRPPARGRLIGLFVVYLVMLGWVVLWKLEVPWVGRQRVVKLVPFTATEEAGASTPLDVWANLLLFFPLGVYLGLLAPSWSWWRAVGVIASVSLALEASQFVLGIGSSDATDVVVNTVGGLAGLGLVALARGGLQARTAGVMTIACAAGTVLVLLGAGLYVSSPVSYVHVRDVGPLARVGAPSGH